MLDIPLPNADLRALVRSCLRALQAGGRRFDSGWLHFKAVQSRAPAPGVPAPMQCILHRHLWSGASYLTISNDALAVRPAPRLVLGVATSEYLPTFSFTPARRPVKRT